MLYNKNKVSKTNDKKILHKVGKQWKVVSVALLLAVAGGAAATATTQANADTTNDADNDSVNSLVSTLNTPASANAPVQAQSSANTNAKSASSASASSVHYYNGDNGTAASYFDKVDQDNATANKYYKAVNSYVNSLGVVYGPQMSNYSAKSASAKSAANNDYKVAKSYSATVNDPKTMTTIDSLAAKSGMDPTLYVNMVEDNEQTYSNAVSSASADVKAASDVQSLVNKLEGTNFSAASLSASTADVVANSNLSGAKAVQSSVALRYGKKTGAEAYVNIANKLSAGAQTLLAEGNPVGLNAQLSMLLNDNKFSSADQSKANKAYSSAVSSEVSAAKSAFNSVYSLSGDGAETSLDSYANGTGNRYSYGNFDSLVASTDDEITNALTSASANTFVTGSALSEFTAAVSAATAQQFSTVLTSAASSLYGKWNPQYIGAKALASESTSANQSAANAVNNAQYLVNVANANQNLVNKLSGSVSVAYTAEGRSATESNAIASVADDLLNNGTDKIQGYDAFVVGLGLDSYSAGNSTTIHHGHTDLTVTSSANSSSAYMSALEASLGTTSTSNSAVEKTLLSYVYSAGALNVSNSSESSIAGSLSNLANDFKNLAFDNANETSFSATGSTLDMANLGSALKSATGSNASATSLFAATSSSETNLLSAALNSSSATKSNMDNAAQAVYNALSEAANDAILVRGTDSTHTNGLGWVAEPDTTTTTPASYTNLDPNSYLADALLSNGVDVDALSDEAPALSDVANVVSSNASSEATDSSTVAEVLGNGLSLASSSATSVDNSAVNASASYSTANDEDVTLASYFASSYTSDASSESDVSSSASSALTKYLKSAANDTTFASEFDAYNNAVAAATNDYKLGVANAKAVYNSLPHFLDVLKSARLHTTPNFGAKDDKVVGWANKGDRLIVKGVNVSRNNNWRGVVRFAVKDATNGKSGFFTGQQAFWKGAYLPSTAQTQNVSVKTLKPVKVYNEENGKKSVGTVPAGKVLSGVTVVWDNDAHDGQGFTKVETANLQFLTANTDYVAFYSAPVQKNNTPNYNFNLQNPDQGMSNYYNDSSLN